MSSRSLIKIEQNLKNYVCRYFIGQFIQNIHYKVSNSNSLTLKLFVFKFLFFKRRKE